MRQTNSSTTSYQPGEVPADVTQLQRFLREELAKLKSAIDTVADGFAPVVYAYPAKPRAGMIRNFDGTTINPGSGAGLYRFDGSTWKFLG